MRPLVIRFVIIGAVLAAIGLTIALSGSKNTPTGQPSQAVLASQQATAGPKCIDAGKPIAMPSWFPASLTLPPGSVATQEPQAPAGSRRVILAAKGTLAEFVKHVLSDWPKRGWTLGHGDAEPGEAEDSFISKKEGLEGAFKARDVLCDRTRTWVLVVIANVPAPSPRAS